MFSRTTAPKNAYIHKAQKSFNRLSRFSIEQTITHEPLLAPQEEFKAQHSNEIKS